MTWGQKTDPFSQQITSYTDGTISYLLAITISYFAQIASGQVTLPMGQHPGGTPFSSPWETDMPPEKGFFLPLVPFPIKPAILPPYPQPAPDPLPWVPEGADGCIHHSETRRKPDVPVIF